MAIRQWTHGFRASAGGLFVPATPPGGSGLWRGNEPAGMTPISDRPFDALNELGWGDFNFVSGTGLTTDATAPHSPSNVLRFVFPNGFNGGSSTGVSGIVDFSYKTLYVAYYFKYSANWQGHSTGFNKHGYCWINNDSVEVFFTMAYGGGNGDMELRVDVQGAAVGDNMYAPNLAAAVMARDQWHLVEYILVGNSASTADGTIDWYLNGTHVGHVTGIQWSSGAANFSQVSIFPVWGGSGDVVAGADQYIEFDQHYQSGKA